MEKWIVIIVVTACIALLITTTFSLKSKSKSNLPPGPRDVPIISSILWLRKSCIEVETALTALYPKFGPILTLNIVSHPFIFICSSALAHQSLVQNGGVFADRPMAPPTEKIFNNNHYNISLAGYGLIWRLLRRNLTKNFLHPSRAKDFSSARKWVLDTLLSDLRGSAAPNGRAIKVLDHFRFAIFCLLVFMSFGDKLEQSRIKEIEAIQKQLLTSSNRFQILNFWTSVTRILLRNKWNELFSLKKEREEVLLPHIRARKLLQEAKMRAADDENNMKVKSYIDTLLTFDLLSEDGMTKRKLSEDELVILCSEFLNAGTDTTSTALQWTMTNLVKYPNIQNKLHQELKGVIGAHAEDVGEDELSKMPYLEAVVLEGLRRHPPSQFSLPHAVTEEAELGGYKVPKNAYIFFMVSEIGCDPNVWDDPMQFKPERFLSNDQEEVDITGSRENKMMPFGAGRRICPALRLAMLHLKYFLANLVWKYEWTVADGDEVDLTEKQEFTVVMKHPLHAHISPRLIK